MKTPHPPPPPHVLPSLTVTKSVYPPPPPLRDVINGWPLVVLIKTQLKLPREVVLLKPV